MRYYSRSGARYIGPAALRGLLFVFGDYPAALPARGACRLLHGVLYALRDAASLLAALDGYKECAPRPLLFRRRPVVVHGRAGRPVPWPMLSTRQPVDRSQGPLCVIERFRRAPALL